MTGLNWSVARFADKFSIAVQEQITKNLMHTFVKMDTSFGTSKFAISTFFNLKSSTKTDYEKDQEAGFFSLATSNLTLFQVDFLHSKVIMIHNDQQLSLIIIQPESLLAFDVLEDQIGTFELSTHFQDYPIEYQGRAIVTFPAEMPKTIDSSFDLAIPLQSFGSVSVFRRSEDFPKRAFGCDQPLHIATMFQESTFNLRSVLYANFHQEVDSSSSSNRHSM